MEFKKNHKYFKQLQMVCRCVGKTHKRYALCHIEVNENHIVATDGRRLGCLDNFGITPGWYRVTKCTKTIIELFPDTVEGNFPVYEDIIPELCREDEKITIKTPEYQEGMNIDISKLSRLAYDISQFKTMVYVDYLKDFLNCDSFHVIAPDRPVCFFSEGFIGIIMPIMV